MKNTFIYTMAVILLVFTSCKDDDKLPLQLVTNNVGLAGGLRTINIISPTIDLNNLAESEWSITVEEWDAEDGGLLESVDVFVQFQDNTPDNGDSSRAEQLIDNIPASAFAVTSSSGLPRATITVPATDAVNLLGLDPATDIDGGDIFRFRFALMLTDGSVFSSGNLEGNVTGPFFNSPFTYPANVVCDLDEELYSGNYQMELVSGSGGFGRFSSDGQVTVNSISGTQRQIANFTWLPDIGGFPQTLEFDLVCGNISAPSHSTGLGCGGGSITWSTQDNKAPFDLIDDSTFTIILQDFVNDGGCGVQSYEVTLLFTKL